MTVQLARILWHYRRTRRLRFADRAALEAHQQRQLRHFIAQVLPRSPYFRPWLARPFPEWPRMDKAVMMANFDVMNTVGLQRDAVLACALQAEQSRDFRPTLQGYSVGLSSGTSGGRGVFAVSRAEQAQWAGTLLAKLLRHGLFHGERVALFLRASNNLYTTLRNPWLSFEFFDLFSAFDAHLPRLQAYAPTIVVAPAQVLRSLAMAVQTGQLTLPGVRTISVAEVLDAQNRSLIASVFGEPGEIYQATEGFLGATCTHGHLHLNEEFIHVEPEWIDDRRFVPVITDFTRRTQPIVRYRLDDVLCRDDTPCPCGHPSMTLAHIEGRCDDMLQLPGRDGGLVPVFSDVLSRAFAQALPPEADYQLEQRGETMLVLYTPDESTQTAAQTRLRSVLSTLGVAIDALQWQPQPLDATPDFTRKRRRIVRHAKAQHIPRTP